jgi:hypothetical protein
MSWLRLLFGGRARAELPLRQPDGRSAGLPHSQKQKLVVESAIMPKSRAEMLNDLRLLMAEYSVFQRSRPDLPQGNLLELSQDELEQIVMEFQQYKSEQRDEMIRPARLH